MKTVFFSALMSITLVRFDTQDNIWLQSFQFPNGNEWQHQEDNEGDPINVWSLKRVQINGKQALRFKSSKPVSTIRLNNYPYRYKVKKVSPYEFEVKSNQLQAFFNNTDIVEVIVKF